MQCAPRGATCLDPVLIWRDTATIVVPKQCARCTSVGRCCALPAPRCRAAAQSAPQCSAHKRALAARWSRSQCPEPRGPRDCCTVISLSCMHAVHRPSAGGRGSQTRAAAGQRHRMPRDRAGTTGHLATSTHTNLPCASPCFARVCEGAATREAPDQTLRWTGWTMSHPVLRSTCMSAQCARPWASSSAACHAQVMRRPMII